MDQSEDAAWSQALSFVNLAHQDLRALEEGPAFEDREGELVIGAVEAAELALLRLPAPDLEALAQKVAILIESEWYEHELARSLLEQVLGDLRRLAS